MPWALFCSKWFVCLYCEVLPVETVLRIWDVLFYEGSKILFRVALGLLKLNQARLLSKTDFASLAEEFKAGPRFLTIDKVRFVLVVPYIPPPPPPT